MTPFDWRAYLTLALKLASEPDEASRRSAISRAYYACYGLATTYALRQGFSHVVVTHDRIWEWHLRLGDPSGGRINEIGKRIKNSRIAADYRADDDHVASRAGLICLWADQLVALLQALPDDLESSLESDVVAER